jgi:hypothetical protein
MVIGFAGGYGVREAISRKRRREANAGFDRIRE